MGALYIIYGTTKDLHVHSKLLKISKNRRLIRLAEWEDNQDMTIMSTYF